MCEIVSHTTYKGHFCTCSEFCRCVCVATDEPAYFFWELLEAWKKLFLVGFMVLILPGTVPQLVIAFVFSLVFMLLASTAQPFRDGRPLQVEPVFPQLAFPEVLTLWCADGDDYFAKACNFSLTALFFCEPPPPSHQTPS